MLDIALNTWHTNLKNDCKT